MRPLPLAAGGCPIRILIEVGPGELIDRITILEIKLENIRDEAKLVNVRREYALSMRALRSEVPKSAALDALTAGLKEVNGQLWQIEDDIRALERAKSFGGEFIRLARSVYRMNDRRAALKREINRLLASSIVEEKSYEAY
ncbi:MAG TPA: DUF6165 family protein [Methylocella sp.]|nr:DUF6165 family protein [Methylocella sp.]